MFNFAKGIDNTQITVTGVRGLIMLGLLMVKPHSMEDFRKVYVELGLLEENQSSTIIRVDLNTLKHAGCEISGCSTKTNHKYILEKHPFAIDITEDEIKLLKRVYNKAKKDLDIPMLLDFDNFFIKLSEHVNSEAQKEQILGISDLRHYDKQLLRNIYFDCGQKYQLRLTYVKPTSLVTVYKNVIAQKLVLQNNKIYLYGYDCDNKVSTVLNFKRIKEIIARTFCKNEKETDIIKIKFSLKDDFIDTLCDNEQIIETDGGNYIIEAEYYNKFLATQRILSFGKSCTVLEPTNFKEHIINKLKEMRGIYGE